MQNETVRSRRAAALIVLAILSAGALGFFAGESVDPECQQLDQAIRQFDSALKADEYKH